MYWFKCSTVMHNFIYRISCIFKQHTAICGPLQHRPLLALFFKFTQSNSHRETYCAGPFKDTARKITPFRAGIIKANKVLLLREMHSTLQLSVFFFFLFFCQPYPKYWAIRGKKIFYRPSNSYYNSAIIPIKRTFFGSILFQNKLQQRGIPQGPLDKYSDLLICILFKQTSISGQKSVYTVKILILEQIAFAAAFYFGQVFVFCMEINKSMLDWFLLIMCK